MRFTNATLVLLHNFVLIFDKGRACAVNGLFTCRDASADLMSGESFICIKCNDMDVDIM